MEMSNKYSDSTEPPFRLNIKRNFKGDYGFEYTIKGETIQDIQINDYQIQLYLYQQGLISKEPIKPVFLK